MTNLPILAEDAAHASLGASTAARWMACEGSVNLIESLPPREGSSENIAARTGRAAHAMAQRALETGRDATSFIGEVFERDIVVDEEMAQHVQLYLDHVRKVMHIPGVQYWIEKKFTLASLNPPRPMFGTADFAAYDPATRTLYVDDLKYGQGVAVEIEGNPQTKYYALGVWLSLPPEFVVETVTMTIIQPRKDHPDGVIRTVTISAADLAQFAAELLEAARATIPADAPLHAGDHCKFCPAKAVCPELYKKTQEIAATEFDVPEPVLPAPNTITTEQFAKAMSLLHVLDDWSAAMKEYAYQELLAGREVPGFKLVERRVERKWTEENEVQSKLEKLEELSGIDVLDLPKLRSPAQIEKTLGKKRFKELLGEHVVKKSSGLKLVPEDHPSPPVLTGGAEFDMLPAPYSDIEGKKKEEEPK